MPDRRTLTALLRRRQAKRLKLTAALQAAIDAQDVRTRGEVRRALAALDAEIEGTQRELRHAVARERQATPQPIEAPE